MLWVGARDLGARVQVIGFLDVSQCGWLLKSFRFSLVARCLISKSMVNWPRRGFPLSLDCTGA